MEYPLNLFTAKSLRVAFVTSIDKKDLLSIDGPFFAQDTIVGLQAMTEFLKESSPSGLDLHLDVRTEHTAPHFDVTSANSLVLQAKEVKTQHILYISC